MFRLIWSATPSGPPSDELGAAAADVADERFGGGRRSGGDAAEGHRRLLVTGEDAPGDPVAICQRGEEVAPVARVAHGARGDRQDPRRREVSGSFDVGVDDLRDAADRVVCEPAAAVDPVAQPGDPEQSLQLGDVPVLDVGHQEPRGVRSQVNRGDPGRRHGRRKRMAMRTGRTA